MEEDTLWKKNFQTDTSKIHKSIQREISEGELRLELIVIAESILQAPGIWVRLIEEDKIETINLTMTLNKPITISLVYRNMKTEI